jgi:replicative DNA helicase
MLSLENKFTSLKKVIELQLEEIEYKKQVQDHLLGISSGFSSLNKYTKGWQKTEMVLISSAPNTGQTTLALIMARNISVDHQIPVTYLTFDLNQKDIANRLLSMESNISYHKLQQGLINETEWEKLSARTSHLSNAPLIIFEHKPAPFSELRDYFQELKKKTTFDVLIVDYIQLIQNEPNEILNFDGKYKLNVLTRAFKQLARELNILIILLVHTNYDEKEHHFDNHQEQLTDMSIGADQADFVCHLKAVRSDSSLKKSGFQKEILELQLLKNTRGETAQLFFEFEKEFLKVTEL